MRTLAFLILITIPLNLFADYVIVRKNTSIRADHIRNSERIEEVAKDLKLVLLDDGLQNRGYYHVKNPLTGTEGWIYRGMLVYVYGDLPSEIEEVEVTVIDVGAGLCCLMELPNNKYAIYDGGKKSAMEYIRTVIPAGSDIEWLFLSHTDADHWGVTEYLVSEYKVRNILRTDYRASDYSDTYDRAMDSIRAIDYDHNDLNLGDDNTNIQPGKVLFDENEAKLIYVCGFGEPLESWDLDDSKNNNAVSIAIKLEHGGKSILFCGDAVGRKDCQTTDKNIATEKYMVDDLPDELIDSDVLIAPHHGADNANSRSFIREVSPEYVVFSAGHYHRHPRLSTAQRYLDYGVDIANIFRTDRGDHETTSSTDSCKLEWDHQRIQDHKDKSKDDDVLIVISSDGDLDLKYVDL